MSDVIRPLQMKRTLGRRELLIHGGVLLMARFMQQFQDCCHLFISLVWFASAVAATFFCFFFTEVRSEITVMGLFLGSSCTLYRWSISARNWTLIAPHSASLMVRSWHHHLCVSALVVKGAFSCQNWLKWDAKCRPLSVHYQITWVFCGGGFPEEEIQEAEARVISEEFHHSQTLCWGHGYGTDMGIIWLHTTVLKRCLHIIHYITTDTSYHALSESFQMEFIDAAVAWK